VPDGRHDVRQCEQEDQRHDRAILHERQQIGNEDAVPAGVLGEQAQGAEERSVVTRHFETRTINSLKRDRKSLRTGEVLVLL
jgi:hypothetical protein